MNKLIAYSLISINKHFRNRVDILCDKLKKWISNFKRELAMLIYALFPNIYDYIYIYRFKNYAANCVKDDFISNLAFRQLVHEAITINFYLRLREMQ